MYAEIADVNKNFQCLVLLFLLTCMYLLYTYSVFRKFSFYNFRRLLKPISIYYITFRIIIFGVLDMVFTYTLVLIDICKETRWERQQQHIACCWYRVYKQHKTQDVQKITNSTKLLYIFLYNLYTMINYFIIE